MFIFVVLTLFSDWIWVDATEQISMGLEFPVGTNQEIIFTDLDADGDEDMVRYYDKYLQAFENVTDAEGNRLWQEDPFLIQGINPQGGITSLGTGNLDGAGSEEIVVRTTDSHRDPYLLAYVNIDTAWVPDSAFFDDLDKDNIPWHPDFADIDDDGDLDMLGGWGDNEYELFPGFWWNTGTPQQPSWEFDSTYILVDRDPPFHPGYLEHFEHPNWIDWNNDGIWDILYTQWYWADPPPYPCDIHILVNTGSGKSPTWEDRRVTSLEQQDDISVLDWNKDGVEDFLLTAYEHVEGYRYIPGERSGDSILFDFAHPLIWGGIICSYPSAADVNSDGIPELALTTPELYPFLENWSLVEYFIPFLRTYSVFNPEKTSWQLNATTAFWNERGEPWEVIPSHLQYLDFGNDKLIDYVLNINGRISLYRNQGTKTQPNWLKDTTALKDLPKLFPTCFLDIDGDGDKDVIGYSIVDSTIKGFLNVRSDNDPSYMEYEPLVSELEGIKPTYFTAGDITDNDLDLADLAVGIKGGKLTAFFNTGQNNPRWHKHEEVFKSLGVNGNPCLCDGDADGDLDLYLVTGGRLRYYRNESTGGIAESPDRPPSVTTSLIGHEVEVKLTVGTDSDEATLLLYNVAGQRIAEYSRRIEDGEASFRIVQQPGVYFYRLDVENQEFRGKIVIY